MAGYHTRWVRPPDQADDPERVAIREALAFGKAVYDQHCASCHGAKLEGQPNWRKPLPNGI